MDADRFFTRLNPLVLWILRSPLHMVLSAGLMVLTITGRRSGRVYGIPVGYQRETKDLLVVMVSNARRKQWWRNFREPARVQLRLRGRDRAGTAQLVAPESSEFLAYAESTMRRVPGMAGQFGISYDRAAGLTDEQAEILRREIAAVKITLIH